MKELEEFKAAQKRFRDVLINSVGLRVKYKYSGHDVDGVIIEIYKSENYPKVKVKSRTGKEYSIWFAAIISIESC